MKRALQFIQIASGMSLMLGGLLLLLIGMTFVLDPVASQMADDNEPFGPPMSLPTSLFIVVVAGGTAWYGFRLLRSRKPAPVLELRH